MKGRNKSFKIPYVLLPVVFAVFFLIFWFTAGRSVWAYALTQWKAMLIQGSPSYDYEQIMEAGGVEHLNGTVITPLRGEQIGKVTSDAVALQAPLYYGDSVEILESGAGTYTGSYLPGEGGTVLIGAHDATFFAPLEKMKIGDIVKISTIYGEFQYKVTDVKKGEMTDASRYEIHDDQDEIILYTCYPFGVIDEVRTGRFFVYADRITELKDGKE
jgi:sortase A